MRARTFEGWAWLLVGSLAVGCGSSAGSGDDDGGSTGDEDAGRVDADTGDPDAGPADAGSDGGSFLCDEGSPMELPSETSLSRTVDTTGEPSSARPDMGCTSVCDDNEVPDVVFRYTPPESGMLTVSTINPGTTFDTVVSVYDGCSGAGDVLACNDDAADTGSRVVLSDVAPDAPLFIVVDGCRPDDVGEVEVSLSLRTGSSGSGAGSDSCDSPTPLQFTTSDGVEVATGSGDTTGASNDVSVTALCGSDNDAPDHFYSFEADAAGSVTVEVMPGEASYDPMINVFRASACSDPNLERCADFSGPGEQETLNTAVTEADTYIVAIDGSMGTSGPYDVTVTTELGP